MLPLRIISLLLLAILLSTASHANASDKAKVPTPKIVKTWGELKSQPAIRLEDGTTIRLGLETTEVPAGGGFLVYALVDGRKWGSSLGPLHVYLRHPDIRVISDLRPFLVRAQPQRWAKAKQFLFVKNLRARKGRTLLEFKDRENKLIARAQIKITNKPYHSWLTLEQIPVKDCGEKQSRYSPSKIAAAPDWPGYRPYTADVEWNRKMTNDWKLPRHDSAKPGPRLKLSAKGTTLIVKSTHEFRTDHVGHQWLVRVWVNDKPLMGESDNRGRGKASSGGLDWGRELRLDLDLSRLKLKPGDRVSVQLLHCPNDWSYVRLVDEKVAKPKRDAWPAPAMTNRVELAGK